MKLQINTDLPYAVALEGGGARGAYQIGAWQALVEAGVHITAVAGTSVGALNGALIAMGDVERARELWANIHYSEVMDVDDEQMRDLLRGDLRDLDLRKAADTLSAVIHNRGLDVTPLRNWIRQVADPAVIRASETELYIVTYSVSEKKELELRAKDLRDDELHDMLLASAYLPAFRAERMEGKLYADGGVRDVLPLHVLIENGYTNIIAMRLYGPGIMRSVRIPEGTHVYTIAPREKLGGVLEFEAEQSRKNMRLGYYDAMRFLYGLKGRRFYIDAQWDEEQARQYLCDAAQRAGVCQGMTLRAVHEKWLPALAKRLGAEKAEKDGYVELAAALLETAAERQGLEPWQVRTEEELLRAMGGGAVEDVLRGGADR